MRCRSAVIDIPLRLMLTLLIISLSLPVADAALRMQEQDAAVDECASQADSLLDIATTVFLQGVGSVRTFQLELPESTAIRVTEGALLIEYEGRTLATIMVERPAFPLFFQGTLLLCDGDYLRLSSVKVSGVAGVEVERA